MPVRVSFARNAARKLISEARIHEPPISVVNISDRLGLKLFSYTGFPDSISALFDFKNKQILINPNHHENRQKFSIAHEIGHFVLGHFDSEDDTNNEDVYFAEYLKLKHSAEKESEANEFAAELLMPLSLIKKQLLISHDPVKLAEIFKVSEAAMWVRLSKLNLISYL